MQEIQAHELAAGQAKLKEKEATEALDVGLAELWQVDRVTRRQLAAMRWQHARAVLSSEHKQSLIRLPSATSKGVLQQVSFRSKLNMKLSFARAPGPRIASLFEASCESAGLLHVGPGAAGCTPICMTDEGVSDGLQ